MALLVVGEKRAGDNDSGGDEDEDGDIEWLLMMLMMLLVVGEKRAGDSDSEGDESKMKMGILSDGSKRSRQYVAA